MQVFVLKHQSLYPHSPRRGFTDCTDKILFINLTKIKNKYANYKNSVRNDIYEYIIEEDFKNVGTLTNGVNEVLKIPTDIVGCEFAKCKFFIENHDEINKNFNISFDVEFAVKSTN